MLKLLLITTFILNLHAGSDFEKIVNQVMKQELAKVKLPPQNLQLVRGEFESTKEFQARVAKTRANQKNIMAEHKKRVEGAKAKAKQKAISVALEYLWGKPLLNNLKYDADNGYFVADLKFSNRKGFDKKVALKVPRKNARAFKQNFASLTPQAVFDFDGGSINLKDIKVPFQGTKYIALFTDRSIDDTRVAVNIKNDYQSASMQDMKISVAKNNIKSFDTSSLVTMNDLNNMLKKSKAVRQSSKKWLFVVGIETYDYTNNISYAKRSAEMFTKTVQKKLGVPKHNTYTLINHNATQAKIKTNLKKMLRRVAKGDTIYFYYNGHGIPIPSLKNEPYMLPSDSEPDYIADESFFSLKNIYGKLSKSKASKVVAFVDSCFSGVTDGKAVLKGVAATKMKARQVQFDKKKMVVFSAGKNYQYSNGYNQKGHRMFSYYVMKNIIQGNKDVKSLFKTTKNDTYNTSLKEYGDLRIQEPTIQGNARLTL